MVFLINGKDIALVALIRLMAGVKDNNLTGEFNKVLLMIPGVMFIILSFGQFMFGRFLTTTFTINFVNKMCTVQKVYLAIFSLLALSTIVFDSLIFSIEGEVTTTMLYVYLVLVHILVAFVTVLLTYRSFKACL